MLKSDVPFPFKGEEKPVQENLPLHLVAAHEPKLASPVGHLSLDYLGELE